MIFISNSVFPSDSLPIPILLMAYCRPIEFCRIADELESLSKRRIAISIDGPTEETFSANKLVVDLALTWKDSSKHEIVIWQSNRNLGLFEHFSIALSRFFGENPRGLVLEDDLEFRREFIEFLDSPHADKMFDQYFSLCGHNPSSDLSDYSSNLKITWQETNIHTISGWAATTESVTIFLNLLKNHRHDLPFLQGIIHNFASIVTADPLLSRSLRLNWFGKIERAMNSSKPNWDNYWEIAGWSSNKLSVRPSFSLSRESPIIFGQQTHTHTFEVKLWPKKSIQLHLDPNYINKCNKALDVKELRIWGTWRIRAYKEFLMRGFSRRNK